MVKHGIEAKPVRSVGFDFSEPIDAMFAEIRDGLDEQNQQLRKIDEEMLTHRGLEKTMDEERRKRARTTTLDELEEERASQMISTTESESDGDETSSSDRTDEDFELSEDEFLYSEIQSDVGFLDDDRYDFDYHEEMEEDDIDPDELSYEELIALGEMVGEESKGISEDEISKHLKPLTCQSTTNLLIDRCVICQVEYEEGEKIVTLQCDHPYHSDCIIKWLQIKKICPVCVKEVSSAEIANTSDLNKTLM